MSEHDDKQKPPIGPRSAGPARPDVGPRPPGKKPRTAALPPRSAPATRREVSDTYTRDDASKLLRLSLRAAASVAQRATIALGQDGLAADTGQELARRAADEFVGHAGQALSAATAGKDAIVDANLADLAQYWGELLRVSDHVDADVDASLSPLLDDLRNLRGMHGVPHDGRRPADADDPIAALSREDENEVVRLSLGTGRHRLAALLNAPPADEPSETRALLIATAAAADDVAHATQLIRTRSTSSKDSARWADEAEDLSGVIQRIDQWVTRGRIPWDHSIAGLYGAEQRLRDEVGAGRVVRSQGPRDDAGDIAKDLLTPPDGEKPIPQDKGLLIGQIEKAFELDFVRLREQLDTIAAMLHEVDPPAAKPWWEELIATTIQLAIYSMGSYAASSFGEALARRGWQRPGIDAVRDAMKNGMKSVYGSGQKKAAAGGGGDGSLVGGIVLHDPKNLFIRGHSRNLIDAQESIGANFAATRPFLESLDVGTINDVLRLVDNGDRRKAMMQGYTRQLTTDWVNLRAQLAHGDRDGRVRAPENQYGTPKGYGEGILTIEIEVGPDRSDLRRVTLNAEPRVVETMREGPAYAGVTLGKAPFHRSYRFRSLYSSVEVARPPGDMPFDLSGLSPDESRALFQLAERRAKGVGAGGVSLGLGEMATALDAAYLAGDIEETLLSKTVRRP